ncbi:HEPN domain-containing protein [Candidatus Woesearchaeota archaeon]|nr:HEPN domain-containing protein [Candidatus Woesearchaeota archaeon]
MDLMVTIYLERADTELLLAEKIKIITEEDDIKVLLKIPQDKTFYSSVISHAYYAIFYAAKAILVTKGIKTSSSEVHKKTFDEFKNNFVDTGVLDVKLLEIYKKIVIRADVLLGVFKDEKWKRGHFTYNTIPQANKEPADDSLANAKLFVSNIAKVIG